ncbi:MAG: glycosyltransferase family 2 protein, partial [Pseudobdellovibrionaceae bacterium]|nr:glycosyltransferase family 2 protein [Pseudobdellovibrionaceae bacterium]
MTFDLRIQAMRSVIWLPLRGRAVKAELLVSIVIPVKNGYRYLREVLEAVGGQETDFAFEIVVVDSGSTDGSLEVLKKHNVQLIEINSHEFNHGSTRNLAISKTRGQFVVMLTH